MELLSLAIAAEDPALAGAFDWESMGFCVTATADSGEEALDIIQNKAPRVVITEIGLKSMTGLEMIEQARNLREAPVFVIINGCREFECARSACGLGVFSYLPQPLEESVLRRTMEEVRKHCRKQEEYRRERALLRRYLLEDKDSYLQVMLHRYLQGSIGEERMKEILRLLGEEAEADWFTCVCADMDVSCKITNTAFYEEERNRLFCCLEQMFEGKYRFRSFEMENGMHVFLLRSGVRGGMKDVKEITESAAGRMESAIVSAVSKEYKGFSGIRKSFHQAARLFAGAREAGESVLIHKEENTEHRQEMISAAEAEGLVVNAIRRNDAGQLKEAMIAFVQRLSEVEQQKTYIHRLVLTAEFTLRESYGMSEQLARSFCDFYSHLGEVSEMKAVDICYKLFQMAVEERKQLAQQDPAFSRGYMAKALAYIDANLQDEELTLGEVAAEVYLNPVYFGRVFKKSQGVSFKQYLRDKRIELAKRLLLEEEMSISAISERAGFPGHSYFSQVFKQQTGMLPSEYRKYRN